MGKPRIILADTDENYIIPLEIKFLEELGDEIDLEIITDVSYFKTLFSSPQMADILAVSQEFYTGDLHRHEIRNLFLLGELPDEDISRHLDIPYVYKYSSLKEIYGKIMAYSNSSLQLGRHKPGKSGVIILFSAVGGVGKTTLALGISTCLAQNFKKVLYIAAEHMNTFQYYLSSKAVIPMKSSSRIIGAEKDLYKQLKPYIQGNRFSYLPPFSAALSSLNLPYHIYEKFIISAKASGDYDAIVVDADSLFDSDKARLISLADKVFLITDQSKHAVLATNQLMKNLNCKDDEKYYFICNRYQKEVFSALDEETKLADFIVDEYVEQNENMNPEELSALGLNLDIQRLSFLTE